MSLKRYIVFRPLLVLCRFAMFALVLLNAGCDTTPQADYSDLNLVDVTGTVKLDDIALPEAVVTVHDLESGIESYGLTDSNGEYRLHFNSEKYGVMPGEKRISISTAKKVLGLNSESEEGETETDEEVEPSGGESPREVVPPGYHTDSKLKATITDSTQTLDFNLKSDGSTTGPE